MRLNIATPDLARRSAALANLALPGSRERLVGHNGDINAGSRHELMSKVVEIAKLIGSGHFKGEIEEADAVMTAGERSAALRAAYVDKSSGAFAELGASIAATVTEHAARSGFARMILQRSQLEMGSIMRVRTRQRNVQCVVANGPAQVAPQMPRDQYIYPNEFQIVANIVVAQNDINQGSPDLLQEKYMDAQQAFLVAEDRTLTRLANVAAPILNSIQYFSGTLTPAVFKAVQQEVSLWKIPVAAVVMSEDLLTDLVTGSTFAAYVDPVTKLEMVQTGRLGSLFGTDLITDAHRDARLKVLESGELFAFGAPDYVGAYSDRGAIQSQPRENAGDTPGRGWFMHETMSMAISNAKGVAKAKRI